MASGDLVRQIIRSRRFCSSMVHHSLPPGLEAFSDLEVEYDNDEDIA